MRDRRGPRNVPLSYRGSAGRELLVFAALLVGASLVLLWLARSQGPTRTIEDVVPFEGRGTFDYSAALGRNIYDDDQLRVPQPLFRRLGERLPLNYAYEVRSTGPTDSIEGGRGSYSIIGEVRQSNGWVRTVTLVPHTEFEGAGFQTAGVVDVATFGDYVRRLETETGYKAPSFQVRIRAHVEFAGRLRNEPVTRALDQTLMFTLNEFELRLEREGTEIERIEPGDVKFEATVARTMPVPLLGTEVSVASLPRFALYLLAPGVLLALLVGIASLLDVVLHPLGAGPPAVPPRYRDRVIDVDQDSEPPPGGGRVRLNDLPSLLRLAEQYQVPVLRSMRGEGATYWVVSDSVYVFDEAFVDVRPEPAPAKPRALLTRLAATVAPPAGPNVPIPDPSPRLDEPAGVATVAAVAAVAAMAAVAAQTAQSTSGAARAFGVRAVVAPPPVLPPLPEEEPFPLDAARSPRAALWLPLTSPVAPVEHEAASGSLGLLVASPRTVRLPDPIVFEPAEPEEDVELPEAPRALRAPVWPGVSDGDESLDADPDFEVGSLGLGLPAARPHAAQPTEQPPASVEPAASAPPRVYWGGVLPQDESDEATGTVAA